MTSRKRTVHAKGTFSSAIAAIMPAAARAPPAAARQVHVSDALGDHTSAAPRVLRIEAFTSTSGAAHERSSLPTTATRNKASTEHTTAESVAAVPARIAPNTAVAATAAGQKRGKLVRLGAKPSVSTQGVISDSVQALPSPVSTVQDDRPTVNVSSLMAAGSWLDGPGLSITATASGEREFRTRNADGSYTHSNDVETVVTLRDESVLHAAGVLVNPDLIHSGTGPLRIEVDPAAPAPKKKPQVRPRHNGIPAETTTLIIIDNEAAAPSAKPTAGAAVTSSTIPAPVLSSSSRAVAQSTSLPPAPVPAAAPMVAAAAATVPAGGSATSALQQSSVSTTVTRSGRPQQLGARDAVSMSAASDHTSSSVPSVSSANPSSTTTGAAAAANIVLPSSDPCTVLVRNLSVDLTEQGLLLDVFEGSLDLDIVAVNRLFADATATSAAMEVVFGNSAHAVEAVRRHNGQLHSGRPIRMAIIGLQRARGASMASFSPSSATAASLSDTAAQVNREPTVVFLGLSEPVADRLGSDSSSTSAAKPALQIQSGSDTSSSIMVGGRRIRLNRQSQSTTAPPAATSAQNGQAGDRSMAAAGATVTTRSGRTISLKRGKDSSADEASAPGQGNKRARVVKRKQGLVITTAAPADTSATAGGSSALTQRDQPPRKAVKHGSFTVTVRNNASDRPRVTDDDTSAGGATSSRASNGKSRAATAPSNHSQSSAGSASRSAPTLTRATGARSPPTVQVTLPASSMPSIKAVNTSTSSANDRARGGSSSVEYRPRDVHERNSSTRSRDSEAPRASHHTSSSVSAGSRASTRASVEEAADKGQRAAPVNVPAGHVSPVPSPDSSPSDSADQQRTDFEQEHAANDPDGSVDDRSEGHHSEDRHDDDDDVAVTTLEDILREGDSAIAAAAAADPASVSVQFEYPAADDDQPDQRSSELADSSREVLDDRSHPSRQNRYKRPRSRSRSPFRPQSRRDSRSGSGDAHTYRTGANQRRKLAPSPTAANTSRRRVFPPSNTAVPQQRRSRSRSRSRSPLGNSTSRNGANARRSRSPFRGRQYAAAASSRGRDDGSAFGSQRYTQRPSSPARTGGPARRGWSPPRSRW